MQKKELDLKQKEIELKKKQLALDSVQKSNNLELKTVTKVKQTQPKKETSTNELSQDYIKKYTGVWTNEYTLAQFPNLKDEYRIIQMNFENNKFRIREMYDASSPSGTEFFGIYKNGKITAIGNAQDFYKFEFPTFKVLDNGDLLATDGGSSEDGDLLKKSSKRIPNIQFNPPVNRD